MEDSSWNFLKCKSVCPNGGMAVTSAIPKDDESQQPHRESVCSRYGRFCRFCYCDDPDGGWLCPCKCSGSLKWVHNSCFSHWLDSAPLLQKVQCTICKYIYKKRWRLKPYAQWCMPDLTAVEIDVFRTILDGFFTYKLFNTCKNFLHGRRSLLAVLAGVSFWRLFIVTDRQVIYWKNLFCCLASSVFQITVVNAG